MMLARKKSAALGVQATACAPERPSSPALPPPVVLALVVVLGGGLASAAPVYAQGGATGAFSRIGFGARGIGAGNARVADRTASPYYNPAFAPLAEQQHVSVAAALMSFDREMQFLQFAAPLEPRAGVVFGLTHAGVSDIDGRDASGYHTETLSTDAYQVFAAFGLRFSERVSGGLAAKFYRADYGLSDVDPVEAVGFDLGLGVQATERLALGLAATDLLARYEWNTSGRYADQQGRVTGDRLPLRLRLGATYALFDDRLKLLAEYASRFTWREVRTVRTETLPGDGTEREETEEKIVSRHDATGRLGVAYRPVEMLTLRAGLDRLAAELGPRPTAGFGIRQDIGQLPVRVSYGFAYERGPGTAMHLFALRLSL